MVRRAKQWWLRAVLWFMYVCNAAVHDSHALTLQWQFSLNRRRTAAAAEQWPNDTTKLSRIKHRRPRSTWKHHTAFRAQRKRTVMDGDLLTDQDAEQPAGPARTSCTSFVARRRACNWSSWFPAQLDISHAFTRFSPPSQINLAALVLSEQRMTHNWDKIKHKKWKTLQGLCLVPLVILRRSEAGDAIMTQGV